MSYIPTKPPADWPSIELTPNSLTILTKRYLRRGEDGKPVETVDEMFYRIARHIASAETSKEQVDYYTKEFYFLLTGKKFFPNTPTFTGAGTPLGQLAACFVLPIEDDLGRSPDGIMSSLRNAALIQQTGGGNGFSFSRLRQKGAFVKTSSGTSTGPVGFLKVYDSAFGMIAQGGSRRGANMAVLRVDHPDIREFITCKASEMAITNFNISVGITDKFMQAVKDDTTYELIAPHNKEVIEVVNAREIFNLIVKYAHHNGEPGVLFLDSANRYNPVPHLYELESTNPCGEQWLGPYENCCLGSINLIEHVTPDNKLDWDSLRRSIELSARFLDNVVTVNAYVEAVPQLKEAAMRCRRIGLGLMGLADIMCCVGVRYGSYEGEVFASQVVEFIRYHAMETSINLAIERGAFPALEGSIYDPNNFTWKVPTPLPGVIYGNDENCCYYAKFRRPSLDWNLLRERLLKYGIRNAAQTTIAPTGTIATVSGCEGYGCEPKFALAYIRHVNDNGKDLVLKYCSPLFSKMLDEAKYTEQEKEAILNEVMENGSCQNVKTLSADLKNRFVVAGDISAQEHVRMQAALQAFIDNSISKTCNLPAGATEDDVAQCYLKAWELGCKGITVYVTGSRQVVVIETKKEIEEKKKAAEAAAAAAAAANNNNVSTPNPSTPKGTPPKISPSKNIVQKKRAPVKSYEKKPRPKILVGSTITVKTPLGKAYVTINDNVEGEPFEVFVNTSKAGSETAAVSEAFGRLISYILRLNSPVDPAKRLKHVVKQLFGIGGRRSAGFGSNQVLSLPDGIAKSINSYFVSKSEKAVELMLDVDSVDRTPKKNNNNSKHQFGDLCPDCGDSSLIYEEGCKKCYSCGYSEC